MSYQSRKVNSHLIKNSPGKRPLENVFLFFKIRPRGGTGAGGLKRSYEPPRPESGREAGCAPEEPPPPSRAAHRPAGAAANRDSPPREPRPVLLRDWGKDAQKSERKALGVIRHQEGQTPCLAWCPHPSRSHPYPSRHRTSPPLLALEHFFLFLKYPKAGESQEACASSTIIILPDRSGQGSRGSAVGTQRRNTGSPSPAHSELIGISHFPNSRVFAAGRTADSGPARPGPTLRPVLCLDFEGRYLFLIVQ